MWRAQAGTGRPRVAVSDIEPLAPPSTLIGRSSRKKVVHARVAEGVRLVVGCTARARSRRQLLARSRELSDVAVLLRRILPSTTNAESAADSGRGSLVLVGRIVTMDEPPIEEALLIQDGSGHLRGSRDDVLALADEKVPVVDIGANVAYPGFIDAHSHWIGDRGVYGVDYAAEAMEAAITRGWTSISEQWNDPGKLDELEPSPTGRAAASRRRLPCPERAGAGWPALWRLVRRSRARIGHRPPPRPGPEDHARQRLGHDLPLGAGRADRDHRPRERGGLAGLGPHRQHRGARMVLDAFEAVIGPAGPNPLHHRIDHAIQVADDQLARMVAMDLASRDPPGRCGCRLGARGRLPGALRPRQSRRRRSAGLPAGETSSTPGCTSPPHPMPRGCFRTSP